MKFLITAGGSGGHIYPALSVLEKIKKDKSNIYLFVGTTNRMESTLIPSLNIPYKGIEIYGLRKNIIDNIKHLPAFLSSVNKAKKILKEFKPDVVLAFGGYVTYPVVVAAKRLKIKVMLHEQNVIPGKTNKALSKFADKVFVSFEESKKYFNEKKTIFTGNPCGERAKNMKPVNKVELGFTKRKKLIIIVMGSLGSPAANEKLFDFLRSYESENKEILFITGKPFYDDLNNNLIVPKSTTMVPYYDKLPSLMKSADLIISRAGASTISEILACNLPSILIPSPHVANNHQYYNALDLENKKVSVLLEEKDITKETLIKLIETILDDKKKYFEMVYNLKNIDKPNASTIIYEETKKI